MTVRIPLTPKLLAALCVIASTGGGCSDTSSSTDLLGTATIEQVMVTVNSVIVNCTGACVDPLADPLSSFELTYGSQFQYNQCGYDETTETRIGPCPATAQGEAQTCKTDGTQKGTCVAADGLPPIVKHAMPSYPEIRVVAGELLDGKTLEQFACACQTPQPTIDVPNPHPLLAASPTWCGTAKAWTIDPFDCSSCGGDSDTAQKCIDLDNNGVPDISSLLPDLATIKCPEDGSLLSYSVAGGEGFFYPSGNQFQSSWIGLQGMGPAIVLQPQTVLPTNTDCFLAVSDKVKTKKGDSLQPRSSIYGEKLKFHTDTLGFDTSYSAFKPAPGAEGVSATTVVMIFNAPLDPATVNTTNFGIADPTGTAVALESVTAGGDGSAVKIELPTTGLAAATKYKVTVKQAVKDTYGLGLAADLSYSFTTK